MAEDIEGLAPEEIKDLRNRLGMNQDEMAELLDVSVGTIHRWEKGKTQPRAKRMKQLKILRQKVSEFGGDTVKHGLEAWLTFSPKMIGGLAGASVEMLLQNSFARWVEILQNSANEMITQSSFPPSDSNQDSDES